MRGLLSRVERLAQVAQRRRLQEIAGAMQARGLVAELGRNEIICRGGALVQRWLTDPVLRFAGRAR